MIVVKFGGTTIGTPERIERCLELVAGLRERRPVVVVSAHGRTTDALARAAEEACAGRIHVSPLREEHLQRAAALGVPGELLEPLLAKLEALLHGVLLLKECTPRTRDHLLSFGERLAARTVAGALSARGLPAVPVDAWDLGLVTDSRFGQACPEPGCEQRIGERLAAIDDLPVVTGFIAKDAAGDITTLGRSGSDYSATLLAAAAGAEQVRIYKDVEGVMSADPSLEAGARNIPAMSFEEAAELAYFGAEVLHPAAILPAIEHDIPVRVINAFGPDAAAADAGTSILSRSVSAGGLAKSVVYKEDVCLLHLRSPRLHAVPEVLRRALAALAEIGVVAHMIGTSQAGMSLITQSGLDAEQRRRAAACLQPIADSRLEAGMAIICLVGEELRGRADSVARIFTALAAADINPRVITRSASEINLAFLVPDQAIEKAVRCLHPLLIEDQPGRGAAAGASR